MQIAAWLLCAFAVAGGLNQVLRLIERLKDKPAPADLRAEGLERFVPKPDFERHVAWDATEHEKILSSIASVDKTTSARMESISHEWLGLVNHKVEELVCAGESGREKLHERITGVAREVSELTAASELHNQRLAAIDMKLDRLIERRLENL